jgi:Ca2+ transporting ATPase
MILQVLIVEFGTVAFHVAQGGLSLKWWGLSVGIGILSLPVQQAINLFFWIGQKYHTWRINRRRAKNYALSVRVADNGHVHRE